MEIDDNLVHKFSVISETAVVADDGSTARFNKGEAAVNAYSFSPYCISKNSKRCFLSMISTFVIKNLVLQLGMHDFN